ncbi:hypothetical protein [Hymenobacter jeollabukensis]|uniref:Uncharacterized protein n=1 Tax=Hymenobacter jeollabukensis TaxID=2025313 RepID=A0A5R8WTK1_9BACT|nr:hypothetical protein [Hymenobacter jeollabukensis]TLM95089.1 hypothetical protein FDY95_04635 [Hymenobacter jeollabukensis]
MRTARLSLRFFLRPPLRRLALVLALAALSSPPLRAQRIPARPDSVVVPSPAASVRPDSVRAPAVPPEPPPDTEPTPGPVSRRAGWTILGACALLTLSTLLLYNVRSR